MLVVGPKNLIVLFLHTCYISMFPACCFHQRTYVAQGLVNGVLSETCSFFSSV